MKRSRSIWLTDETYQKLAEIAQQEDRSFSKLVEIILMKYLQDRVLSMPGKDTIR